MEKCNGCYSKYRDNICTRMHRYWRKKDSICPCGDCLVKVICIISCEPFEGFWIRIDATRKELNDERRYRRRGLK